MHAENRPQLILSRVFREASNVYLRITHIDLNGLYARHISTRFYFPQHLKINREMRLAALLICLYDDQTRFIQKFLIFVA